LLLDQLKRNMMMKIFKKIGNFVRRLFTKSQPFSGTAKLTWIPWSFKGTATLTWLKSKEEDNKG
jgi:hypothetical protein